MMRIITGTARGTKLETPEGMATRPTSERAKEAIFSSLQFEIRGKRVLDLFAGSGQMGLEALSRGAECAVFCDMSQAAITAVKRNAAKTHLEDRCRIIRGDSLAFLDSAAGGDVFDIVFIDPPYAAGLVPACIEKLVKKRRLAPGAILVCETAKGDYPVQGIGAASEIFSVLRETVYGAALVTMLRCSMEAVE